MSDQKQNGGDLVPLQPVSNDIMEQLGPDWKNMLAGPSVYTSLDQSSQDNRLETYRALTAKAISAKTILNLPITIFNFVMSPCEKLNPETGELERFMRIVLFGENGELYESFSKGVVKSIMQIQRFYRNAPWNDGLKCTIVDEGQPGKNWYVIRLLVGVPIPENTTDKPHRRK